MLPEYFQGHPADIQDKLGVYHAHLLKWQKAINLVSPKTIGDAWHRHFVDSAQINDLLPENCRILFDFGSGAGFPALVLAILRPDIDVHMVESDERKGQFLRTVSRETKTPVHIHTCRIENLETEAMPDVISARALASLNDLCSYALPYAQKNPDLELLFLKGAQAYEEIEIARQSYDFDVESQPSMTDPAASILRIMGLRPCE